MQIRGHHLWVLSGVAIKGGSAAHVEFDVPEEYKNIVWKLRQKTEQIYEEMVADHNFLNVHIIDSVDDICAICPNNDGVKCIKYSEIELSKNDREAIGEYELSIGGSYFADMVLQKIIAR